jgi:hypothetical protein
VKLSVSISADDVEFIDQFAVEHGVDSRSGVVQQALSLLRSVELGDDYAGAWADWSAAGAEDWESTIGDGLR